MASLHEQNLPVYLPSLAVHLDSKHIVLTIDVLRGLIVGKQYIVGNKIISSAPNERAMLKRTNWASRAVEMRS